jgi:copper ion binding protein
MVKDIIIMEKKTLKVEGMSCEHCVKAVTKALSQLSGVKKVKVDLKGASASFEFDPAKIGLEEIAAAIADSGFSVGS